MYALARPLLFSLPAETAHELAMASLRAAQATPGAPSVCRRACTVRDPALAHALETEALGLRLANPVGLAAGFDKNAVAFDALSDVGFGWVEVGTLTAHPQRGNPRPRLFRLPQDRALVNRLGFNNCGAAAAAPRLARPRRATVGVNIGKSKITPAADAAEDYVASTRLLAPHADYLVVNVSSPNTPGLRDLQAVDQLRPLLEAVQRTVEEGGRAVPLLVKIAPDLADEDVDAVADLAVELGLAGIVATNTTLSRAGLRTPERQVAQCGAGGLSGPPLRARATEVLRRLYLRAGRRLLLVGCGGIDSVDDAWARIRAGATLLQVYTGFVYGGPRFPAHLAEGLARRAKSAGFQRVQEAVGAEHR